MKGDDFIVSLIGMAICFAIVVAITSCAGRQPNCSDNPRNMRCMSADQLRKELSK